MKRHAFALKLSPGKEGQFRTLLGEAWEDITSFLADAGLHNFSLWECAGLVFGYAESSEQDFFSTAQNVRLEVLSLPFGQLGEWISPPGKGMRLMYHDFGIVREDKSLIRHRMFMTRLKPGCEEEYKARHDGLIQARGGVIDPGPDSNFSIWSAGGYIFGYDEIDTSMESGDPQKEQEASREWETRQLEIMDWITNDVDWLTGQIHPASVRLAWKA